MGILPTSINWPFYPALALMRLLVFVTPRPPMLISAERAAVLNDLLAQAFSTLPLVAVYGSRDDGGIIYAGRLRRGSQIDYRYWRCTWLELLNMML